MTTENAAPGAAELARRIRTGRITAVEAVEDCLTRIHRDNARLNALVTVDADGARAAARAADEASRAGAPCGVLHGVPYTAKDTLETRGLRTTAGAEMYRDHVPDRDAWVVQRIRAAGGILLGKTNTPPLAADIQTRGPLLGTANNPWDPMRTPGGSTGGGAAAVAAGLSPLEVGSDHGGSLRIPASFCGTCALKPTDGALPLDGHLHGWPGSPDRARHLVCVGFVARYVEDLALAAVAVGLGGTQRVPEPRVAWWRGGGLPWVDASVAAVFDAAVRRLRRTLDVEEGAPEGFAFEDAWGAWTNIMNAEQWHPWVELARAWAAGAGRWTPRQAVNDLRLREAWRTRHHLVETVDAFMAQRDAWLLPVVSVPAFTHRPAGMPVDVDGVPQNYWLVAGGWTSPFSLTGHPVVVIPAGRAAEGLPVGLQLVGRRGEEGVLLGIAEVLEGALGGFQPPPNPA
ncbi:MAG: amidase [Deltaproteobacteria bacterium]|nr:amidase [Deltaproteobacteria bacterium]